MDNLISLLSTLKALTSLIGGKGIFCVSCYNILGDNMKLISKSMVDTNFSISEFLDKKGYKYNNNYIYLTSYQNNRVYILLFDVSIYTIMVMDGHRYIFEMENDVYGVMDEFKNEIEKVAKK